MATIITLPTFTIADNSDAMFNACRNVPAMTSEITIGPRSENLNKLFSYTNRKTNLEVLEYGRLTKDSLQEPNIKTIVDFTMFVDITVELINSWPNNSYVSPGYFYGYHVYLNFENGRKTRLGNRMGNQYDIVSEIGQVLYTGAVYGYFNPQHNNTLYTSIGSSYYQSPEFIDNFIELASLENNNYEFISSFDHLMSKMFEHHFEDSTFVRSLRIHNKYTTFNQALVVFNSDAEIELFNHRLKINLIELTTTGYKEILQKEKFRLFNQFVLNKFGGLLYFDTIVGLRNITTNYDYSWADMYIKDIALFNPIKEAWSVDLIGNTYWPAESSIAIVTNGYPYKCTLESGQLADTIDYGNSSTPCKKYSCCLPIRSRGNRVLSVSGYVCELGFKLTTLDNQPVSSLLTMEDIKNNTVNIKAKIVFNKFNLAKKGKWDPLNDFNCVIVEDK